MAVGETADTVERTDIAAEEHRPGTAGKDALGDGVGEYLAGFSKLLVLTAGRGWHFFVGYFPGGVHR
jgi:hypothetical protein